MSAIEKRIEELEAKAPRADPLLIVRQIVDPGSNAENTAAETQGQRIARQQNETESDFVWRVTVAALAGITPPKVGHLTLYPERTT